MEQSKPLSGDHKDFDNFKQKIGKHYGSEVVFNETGVRDGMIYLTLADGRRIKVFSCWTSKAKRQLRESKPCCVAFEYTDLGVA